MVSIAVHGGHPPHGLLHDAVDWGRVVVATLARSVVVALLGLVLWAAAPALIGWQPTTVVTGSMEPRLAPGDVVVSRPVAPAEVRPGRILLADDPDQPGHLRMHRYVEAGADGTLVTKGDANPQADSTPLSRSAVHGVAFLRVPVVGTPVVWVREGRWAEVIAVALALAAVLALCTVDGALRRSGPRHRGHDDGRGHGGGHGVGDGREARRTSATSAHPVRATGRHSRRRRLGGVAAALVVATGAGALLPSPAQAAPWPAQTGSAVTLAAATLPVATITGCTGGGSATITWSWPTATANPSGGFELWAGTRRVAVAAGTQRTATFTASSLELLTSYPVTVRALDGTWYGESAPRTVTVVLGVGGTGLITC